ncbi:MAG: rhomboid family intramembrane serine protease [Acidobacteria bacterium]|nr:rhomboid family intramembrane serine protease [Acidobacteriota bacterium]
MLPIRDEERLPSLPLATFALAAANLVVFLWELSLPAERLQAVVNGFGAVPFEIARFTHLTGAPRVPNPATLFTCQFLHGGWLHLVGNVLYLWTFGRRVEGILGRIRFVLFYLLCGAVAGLVQVVMTPQSRLPLIGASGAVAGVLGAWFVRFPFHRIRILIPLVILFPAVRVPAWIFLGGWFWLQWQAAGGEEGIAWYAHIGGFLAGVVLALGRSRGSRRN